MGRLRVDVLRAYGTFAAPLPRHGLRHLARRRRTLWGHATLESPAELRRRRNLGVVDRLPRRSQRRRAGRTGRSGNAPAELRHGKRRDMLRRRSRRRRRRGTAGPDAAAVEFRRDLPLIQPYAIRARPPAARLAWPATGPPS